VQQKDDPLGLDGNVATQLDDPLVAIVFHGQFVGIVAKGLDNGILLIQLYRWRLALSGRVVAVAGTSVLRHDKGFTWLCELFPFKKIKTFSPALFASFFVNK